MLQVFLQRNKDKTELSNTFEETSESVTTDGQYRKDCAASVVLMISINIL